MYVTMFTVFRGDRGLTEVTPYDILEAELGVHRQALKYSLLKTLKIMIKNIYFIYMISINLGE